MLRILADAFASKGFQLGLVVTTLGFGLRHGIDWDHIAAITDITSAQQTSRTSMLYATLYALGHALVVFAIGVIAIVLGENLPSGVDVAMEKIVGVTLLILGIYVFYSLIKHGRDFRMRSRWMLIFSGIARAGRWIRGWGGRPSAAPGGPESRERADVIVVEHDHPHSPAEDHARQHQLQHEPRPRHEPRHELRPEQELAMARSSGEIRPPVAHDANETDHGHRHLHFGHMPDPADPFMNYSAVTAFGVGMVHGVGAETPTQVLIFLTAAGAAGRGVGVLFLVVFLVGLVISNTVIALASTFGFLRATGNFAVYATVAVITGVFSILVGTLFLFGRGSALPAIFGG